MIKQSVIDMGLEHRHSQRSHFRSQCAQVRVHTRCGKAWNCARIAMLTEAARMLTETDEPEFSNEIREHIVIFTVRVSKELITHAYFLFNFCFRAENVFTHALQPSSFTRIIR